MLVFHGEFSSTDVKLLVVYKIPYRRARALPSASREQRYLAYKLLASQGFSQIDDIIELRNFSLAEIFGRWSLKLFRL